MKTLTVTKTIECSGICMDVQLRIEYDYQPAEAATHFYEGCSESFSICGVNMEIAPGVWVDVSNANYDDGDMVQHILDARHEAEMNAKLDCYFMGAA